MCKRLKKVQRKKSLVLSAMMMLKEPLATIMAGVPPASKKTRLDSPGASLGLKDSEQTTEQQKENEEVMWDTSRACKCKFCIKAKFDFGTSDFKDLLETCHFVDKTKIIYDFVNDTSKVLVTAPRRFGKSAVLNVLKQFFEVEVDDDGNPLKPITEPVTGTPNHHLFSKQPHGKKLIIMQDEYKETVKEHFGRHPLICVNLSKGCSLSKHEKAKRYGVYCRLEDIVHEAFSQHRYLCKSGRLLKSEQLHCEQWISPAYKTDPLCAPETDLVALAKYLRRHFNTKAWVFVDEYDKVICEALSSVPRTEVEDVVTKSNKLLSSVLKDCDESVGRAFVTGISRIASLDFSGLNNITPRMFSRMHRYSSYYGLAEEQVKQLLQRLGKNPELLADISAHYNGYFLQDGTSLYDSWSVMNYLHEGKFESFWTSSGYIRNLKEQFQLSAVQEKITGFLAKDDSSVLCDVYSEIKLENLLELHDHLTLPKLHHSAQPNVFISFLLEEGYFSYLQQGSDSMAVVEKNVPLKMPNMHIKNYFRLQLELYYKDRIREIFTDQEQQKCVDIFSSLKSSVSKTWEEFEQSAKVFCEEIGTLFRRFSGDFIVYLNEAAIQSFIITVTAFAGFSTAQEIYVPEKRLDILAISDFFGVLLELKVYKEGCPQNTALAAYNQISDKKYFNAFTVEKYQQFTRKVTYCVMMGLSIGIKHVENRCTRDKRSPLDNKFQFEGEKGFEKLPKCSFHTP